MYAPYVLRAIKQIGERVKNKKFDKICVDCFKGSNHLNDLGIDGWKTIKSIYNV
jgi:hypothetical protein